jgi:hypothetical protein
MKQIIKEWQTKIHSDDEEKTVIGQVRNICFKHDAITGYESEEILESKSKKQKRRRL